MEVKIDDYSGFCFGVVNAIERAEQELLEHGTLYSLGDIVHNKMEMQRLEKGGLEVINHDYLKEIKGGRVYIRAHGEPPSTFDLCRNNSITVIDATCPVVSKLQKLVIKAFQEMEKVDGQVVIIGKLGHPEVISLNGQIDNKGIIIENIEDIEKKVNYNKPIFILSQTTQSLENFRKIKNTVEKNFLLPKKFLTVRDTICRNVSNRTPHLKKFAKQYDLILFVSGMESSNGSVLFNICLQSNPNSHKIENCSDIDKDWLKGVNSIGICGATSTPKWLMENVEQEVLRLTSIHKKREE